MTHPIVDILSTTDMIGTRLSRVAPVVPQPPQWVADWLGPAAHETFHGPHPGLGSLGVARGAAFSLFTLSLPDVLELGDDRFESQVMTAYLALADRIAQQQRHAIRFWNFIPQIQEETATSEQRYMLFNAGRFRAFESWFGSANLWRDAVPTASSVGTAGTTLFIHCLAADSPGRPLENPRQRPAYTYSPRYGARPPSFARATIVSPTEGGTSLLVGGTASILGEETVHADDIARQTRETFDNLATLVRAAFAPSVPDDQPAPWAWLERFRTLRVHVLRSEDAAHAADVVLSHLPSLESVEFVQAELCRRDLLLEIEGVAVTG